MKTLQYAFKKEWYNIILLLLPFIAIPFLWSHLPEQVPIHWNLQGEVDDYGSKTFGLFFIPLLNIGLYLLFLYLPNIDPKKRITVDQKPMPVLRTFFVVFLLAIHTWMIAAGMGYEATSTKWIYLGVAAFLAVIGNYLRTIQPNYFIGIRVPWTLEDEDNWRKTHRMASYIWVAGGLLLIVLFPFFNTETYSIIFTATVITMALIPMAYSFYFYKAQP
jgi:uncharacterized membrane protein